MSRTTLIRSSKILTFDETGPVAEAVVIEDGIIREVGSFAELARGDVEVMDAGDAVVMPGPIDTHPHVMHFGALRGGLVDLSDAVDHADIVERLRARAADTPAGEVQKYDLLVLGSSTWGAGELQDDWYGFLDQLKAQDLSGKKVALFGCGDSGSYPDTFCDAVGLIYDGLQQSGCTFVGAYAPEGYDETGSLVCRGGKFVGLAVDESAPDKTDRRVAAWCEQIKNE